MLPPSTLGAANAEKNLMVGGKHNDIWPIYREHYKTRHRGVVTSATSSKPWLLEAKHVGEVRARGQQDRSSAVGAGQGGCRPQE